MNPPVCWIIAGPNGAGKTTFALNYLPKTARCRNFVNADLIAAGLSPLAPERELIAASRLFLKKIQHHIQQRTAFGFETTLAGQSYLKLLQRLLADGWQVHLIYLALPTVEMSLLRVVERVASGGHDVPPEIIRRRFARSLRNLFDRYTAQVSRTQCFMNIGESPEPVFMQSSSSRRIIHPDWYERLLRQAQL